jgi:hypothetical protein
MLIPVGRAVGTPIPCHIASPNDNSKKRRRREPGGILAKARYTSAQAPDAPPAPGSNLGDKPPSSQPLTASAS